MIFIFLFVFALTSRNDFGDTKCFISPLVHVIPFFVSVCHSNHYFLLFSCENSFFYNLSLSPSLSFSFSLSLISPSLSSLSFSVSLLNLSLFFPISLSRPLSLSLSLSFSLSLCQVSGETQVVAKVTYQNLFRLFPRLSGMTGK